MGRIKGTKNAKTEHEKEIVKKNKVINNKKNYIKFKTEQPERYRELQRNFYERHKKRRSSLVLGRYHFKRKCKELGNIVYI